MVSSVVSCNLALASYPLEILVHISDGNTLRNRVKQRCWLCGSVFPHSPWVPIGQWLEYEGARRRNQSSPCREFKRGNSLTGLTLMLSAAARVSMQQCTPFFPVPQLEIITAKIFYYHCNFKLLHYSGCFFKDKDRSSDPSVHSLTQMRQGLHPRIPPLPSGPYLGSRGAWSCE